MRILLVLMFFAVSASTTWSEKTDYVIVMEDIIARVESTGPTRTITRFVVKDKNTQTVEYDQSGCGLTECFFDLSSLAVGDYSAEAFQDDGSTFSDDISIK